MPEGGRDLEGVAHVDVAGRHEEREDGQQGEGQAQGCNARRKKGVNRAFLVDLYNINAAYFEH